MKKYNSNRKILFFLLLLSFFSKSLACKCETQSIAKEYFDSDLVAIISIEKTYGNHELERNGMPMSLYKADVEFLKIYKGKKITTLNIFGSTSYANSGACEILIKPREKYLMLLNKNNDGEYYISLCTEMIKLDSDTDIKKIERIFTILEKNKNKIPSLQFVKYDDSSLKYNDLIKSNETDFTKLKIRNLDGKVGIYKVTSNAEGIILNVIPIQKIGINERKIQKLIKKNIIIHNGLETRHGEYLILLDIQSG